MRWKSHVRFGRRAAETDRSKDRHRAVARPHTEHRTDEGKLYLCAIKDVWSNRIVGYSIDSNMRATLAVRARCTRRSGPGSTRGASCTRIAGRSSGRRSSSGR